MRTHFSRSVKSTRDMLPMTVGLIPFGMVWARGHRRGASPVAALFSGAAQIIAASRRRCAVCRDRAFVLCHRPPAPDVHAALAPYVKPVDHRWRNLVAFLLTDQAFASSIRRFRESSDIRANVSYFVGGGAVLWLAWQIATIAGILAGAVIPASWQLEFVVPLCFLALLAPLLHDRTALIVFAIAAIALEFNANARR